MFHADGRTEIHDNANAPKSIEDRVIGDRLNARNMKSHSGPAVIKGACLRSSKDT
jgi:hypothetical protein